MSRPHVQVILGDHAIPPGLREAVRRVGASVSFRPLSDALRSGLSAAADAVVIVVPDDMRELNNSLHVLLDRVAERPRATLLLKADGGLVPRITHPETVPVTFGSRAEESELAARLGTMVAMRASLDCLHKGMLATRRSEENATRRYANQLRLASQIQRELIPETLPSFGPVTFSTVFRPADQVSGDIYDVHRLDETHVAIALADATGHGIPAALLTVFVKRALRGQEIEHGQQHVLQPDEVLARLNQDLLDADLSDCQFVALTFAVLDTQTMELSLARGGSPYPLLRRADSTVELLRPAGGAVGISSTAKFARQTVRLAPGDAVLLCSDGLERVVLPPAPVLGLAEAFTRSAEILRQQAAGQPWAEFATADQQRRARTCGGEREPALVAAGAPAKSDEAGNLQPAPAISVACGGEAADPAPQRGPDEALLSSSWCEMLRSAGTQAALEQLVLRHETLRRMGHPLDDLTVLVMQVQD